MAQTTLINTITKTGDYPEKVSVSAENNCGTLQLLLGGTWTNQMIHELPTINISIYTTDNTKYLSFDVDMSTVNEELIKLEPTNPYSIAIYNIPSNFSFYITPIFDKYALSSHNAVIKDGNIEIFNTTDKGIVDSNENDYDSELWTTPTDTFDISIIFDDSNISSSGGGGGSSQTVIAANVTFDPSGTDMTSTNVQDAIVELDTAIENTNDRIDSLPEPMVFKGSLGVGGTIESLPEASESNKGFTYKVITAGTYQGVATKVGDTLISDVTTWILIPSGDEPSGTVTSVGVIAGAGITVTGTSPITTSGTFTIGHINSIDANNEEAVYSVTFDNTGHLTNANKVTSLTLNCVSTGLDGTPETYIKVMKQFFASYNPDTLTPKELTDLCAEWYYQTRDEWNGWTTFENTGVSTGTKGGNNLGLVCIPSTESQANQDDYAGLPLFYPIDVNFEIDADTKDILITGIDGITSSFERNNPDKFVGVMQMAGYAWTKEDLVNNTFTNGYSSQYYEDADQCWILPEAVRLDGTHRQFVVHTKYMGAIVDGKLKSYSGVVPTSYTVSHNNINTYGAANGEQYSGGSVLLVSFLQLMTRIKYASLTQDGIIQGCISYNYQYFSTVEETDVKRFIIPTSQANNLIVGSTVLVGHASTALSASTRIDRYYATVYDISGNTGAIITSIETYDSTHSAVYVDTTNTFSTVGDGTNIAGNTLISTFTWVTGANDNVLGNDGSKQTPSDGKCPAMIQRIEYSVGTCEVFGDVILASNPATTEYPLGYYTYHICKDASKRSTSITSDYIQLNTVLPYVTNTSAGLKYITKITFDSGIAVPSNASGGSSSTYEKDAFYYLATPSSLTTREWLSFGHLTTGVGSAGLSCVSGHLALSGRYWNVGGRVSCAEAFRA